MGIIPIVKGNLQQILDYPQSSILPRKDPLTRDFPRKTVHFVRKFATFGYQARPISDIGSSFWSVKSSSETDATCDSFCDDSIGTLFDPQPPL